MSEDLFSPLALNSGVILQNRIAKASMEEGIAGEGQLPDHRIRNLYRRWGAGGAGMLITGNVMVHAQALTGPGDIVLDEAASLKPFTEWALAAKEHGSALWMQISHPGRQVMVGMPGVVWGPTDISVDLGKHTKRFGQPVRMTPDQIDATIERFATTAQRAAAAGFDGVEVHGAHGYLISQFLSPLVNTRTDEFGGCMDNRARLLREIVTAIRQSVPSSFGVAVKLNSADFQRGGSDSKDARWVIDMLAPLGVDFVELSGGSYERPAMTGRTADESTLSREAYFFELAGDLAAASPLPLMVTGGISRRHTAETVLASGVSIVGMASALVRNPELPTMWRDADKQATRLRPVTWSDKTLTSGGTMALVRDQLRRMGNGGDPHPGTHPAVALISDRRHERIALARYRRWLAGRAGDFAEDRPTMHADNPLQDQDS